MLAYLAVREVLKEIRISSCWNATNCSTIIQCNLITMWDKADIHWFWTAACYKLALTKHYNVRKHMIKRNPWIHTTEFLVHWKPEQSCRYFMLARRFTMTMFSLPSWNLSWFIALSTSLYSSNQGTETKQGASVKNQVWNIMYASRMCTRKIVHKQYVILNQESTSVGD